MNITVDDFNQLDRPTLQSLLPLTNCHSRGDHRDGDVSNSGSSFRRALHDRLRGYAYPERAWAIVIREHGVPVAWCMLSELAKDPGTDEEFSEPTASVGVYVSPVCRRRGLGTRLLEEASGLARKIERRQLLASTWNVSSNSFYRSSGFNELRPYFTGWVNGVLLLPIV